MRYKTLLSLSGKMVNNLSWVSVIACPVSAVKHMSYVGRVRNQIISLIIGGSEKNDIIMGCSVSI